MALLDDSQYVNDLQSKMTNVEIAAKWDTSETSVRRHKAKLEIAPAEKPVKAEPVIITGKVDRGVDGGEFIDVQTQEKISDWSAVFARFDLPPDEFEIVDDTVRCATWQQSKALEDGTRDVVNLFSYRASFRRKASALVDVPDILASLRRWRPATKATGKPLSEPVTMFLGWADWQLGKGDGDGTPGTTQRILDGFEEAEKRIRLLRKQGVNIEGVAFGNMGDHTEMVTGHYTSQRATTDLNLRDQLNLAIELNLTGIKALAPLVDKATYLTCLCNHGQWQREGGKQITDDSDNSTGFLADMLKAVCTLHPALSHVEWVIPRDEMITTANLSGVNVAAAHGHKITGSEENWLAKQSAWLHTTKNFRPELWVTAHRHTALNEDMGNYHRVQCATVDPGSKSFTDATGRFSTQGTTSFVIGRHNKRMISHYEVL